jgi:hypothetical protein
VEEEGERQKWWWIRVGWGGGCHRHGGQWIIVDGGDIHWSRLGFREGGGFRGFSSAIVEELGCGGRWYGGVARAPPSVGDGQGRRGWSPWRHDRESEGAEV